MSKASELKIQQLEKKLAHDQLLFESLQQDQSALYDQLNYISDAAERNNKNRKIASLDKEIEEVLARVEETECKLTELKQGSVPSQPPTVGPPVDPEAKQRQAELDYQNNLQRYRQEFIKAIEKEYPLHEFTRQGLQTFQQQLELREPDVAAIEAPLLEARKAEYQREQEAERLKQEAEERQRQERERAQRAQEHQRQSAVRRDVSPPQKVQTFKFEVVSIRSVEKTLLGLGKPKVNLNRIQKSAEYFSETLGNGVSLEMVSIPGGHFIMGSPEKEADRRDTEGPQHQVTVPAFFMGKYPVTQVQWKAVAALPQIERKLNPDPTRFKSIDRPVERVSWREAMEFCARLSRKTGREYRLPSEAEWEYACRAGTTTPFHFCETITPDLANYDGNYTYGDGPQGEYRQETTPVGHFRVANAFGLYDMYGNVWEWCADHWHDSYEGAPDDGTIWLSSDEDVLHVVRGGSWGNDPGDCRSASRTGINRGDAYDFIGFRVVCSAPGFS